MMTIRRIGYDAAVICWLAAASIVLILPQHASAQVDGAGAPSTALTGSRLHVELPSEAAVGSEPAPAASGAASGPGPVIHSVMGGTARSAKKPAASAQPATTALFRPPTGKPAQAQAGPQDGPREPAATQAAGTPPPPDAVLMPGAAPTPIAAEPPSAEPPSAEPPSAEPPSAEPAIVARRPEATAGEMKARDLQADEQQAGDQQAALASGSKRPDAIASLAFAPDSAALNANAEGVLKDLATRFPAKDEALRLQLMAYASGEDMSASKARRLSLARALAVRSYLMANGIDGARMDVRALGDRVGGSPVGSPADRVDIAMIRR